MKDARNPHTTFMGRLGGLVGVIVGASFVETFFHFLQNETHIIGRYFKGAASKPFSFKGILLAGISFLPLVGGGVVGKKLGSPSESQLDDTSSSVISHYVNLPSKDEKDSCHVDKLGRERLTANVLPPFP